MAEEITRTGGCLCGAVRYTATGEPFKGGLCHCADCRKVTGSSFLAYADWRPENVEITGEVNTFHGRSFCPNCGSRVFSRNEQQVEIYLGTLDAAPNGIAPLVEGWTIRREPWLHPVDGTGQYERDIPPDPVLS
jgi:hypothetical protein